MNRQNYSRPVSLRHIHVTDDFWKHEMELVRTEVIPYQWEALNDRLEGAAPSYCMHNFKAAGKLNIKKKTKGADFVEPTYTFRGFETLPDDPKNPQEDRFYGFVFQDSDFSKWIEAVGYSLTQHPDSKLEEIADGAIDLVCAAQQEDGYLDTYYIINGRDKTFSNLRDHHELYCFGHLTEGAVAYYEATGKDKLLKAVCRFADYIADYFGEEEGKCNGYPGHEIAEMALVRLYYATGEQKYLKLAKYFVDERGKRPYYFDKEHPKEIQKGKEELRYQYHQAHLPVRQQSEAVGHAVRAVYLYSGMADVARLTDDEELFAACERLWNSIVNEKMYITGGIGATHIGEAFSYPYDLPNDTAYAETCASIGLVFFARRMLEIKADSRYADIMERALYNGVLSGMALDGKSFFYVNPLEVNPQACQKDERKFHVKAVRQKWFGCACCPPNIARLLSSIGSYAYTENENTLFVHLYVGGEIEKTVGDRKVSIRIKSELPWNGKVCIEILNAPKDFTLAVRIPGWSEEAAVRADFQSIKDGYCYIKKDWKERETIAFDFPMEAMLFTANNRVREDIKKAAVVRGPIVYCLEETDNGADLHRVSIAKNPIINVTEKDICGQKIKAIEVSGSREHKDSGAFLYHKIQSGENESVTLCYVPYYMWANRGENEMQVWTRYQ